MRLQRKLGPFFISVKYYFATSLEGHEKDRALNEHRSHGSIFRRDEPFRFFIRTVRGHYF